MRGRDLGMLAARLFASGEATALIGDGPKLRANGRACIVDPEGDARRDTPGNPYFVSPGACRCIRFASPTAVAPDAWPARADAWAGEPCMGMGGNGLPAGRWYAGGVS